MPEIYSSAARPNSTDAENVRCPVCRKVIFDGQVLRAPVTRFKPRAESPPKRCKTWVPVPVAIDLVLK